MSAVDDLQAKSENTSKAHELIEPISLTSMIRSRETHSWIEGNDNMHDRPSSDMASMNMEAHIKAASTER